MQDSVRPKNSPLRKIATIVFLPILIVVWMTGWILIQSGDPGKRGEIRYKPKQSNPNLTSSIKESQEQKEDTPKLNEPQIPA